VPDLKQQLKQLLESAEWSKEDQQWLYEYLEKNDSTLLRQILQEEFNKNSGTDSELEIIRARKVLEAIRLKINPSVTKSKTIRLSLRKTMAAAAAIFLFFLSGTYFLFLKEQEKGLKESEAPQITKTKIVPGGNKAVLTLSDNSIIVLDNSEDGRLAMQGDVEVIKLKDGQLSYKGKGGEAEILYNTISTPRGGQYQFTLTDGTKVWLNSASTLRFPIAFSGKERKVELHGEAYFEVAKNQSLPFKVNVAGKEEVEVLGTHFNINSYPDESTIHTTLLEGKIKVTPVGEGGNQRYKSLILSPGQQSQVDQAGLITLNKNPDIERVMAWKNGKFDFGEAMDINSIMKQIARWYDVEVVFQGSANAQIGGSISRTANVTEVFEMLEMTGAVKFKIEGKKVIVMDK
jgi:transmembrane sensor